MILILLIDNNSMTLFTCGRECISYRCNTIPHKNVSYNDKCTMIPYARRVEALS